MSQEPTVIDFETRTQRVFKGIIFDVASEWEGFEKWVDGSGRIMIVLVRPQPAGFAGAFRQMFDGPKEPSAGRVIMGSPDLLDMLGQAPVSAERRALQQIREAGHNDHPTSVWMQKVAAHALHPDKFPHPGEQPKA